MSNYVPPQFNNLPFKFSGGGYQKPDFNDVRFNYSLRSSTTSTAELQAGIEVMQTYKDSTYTFLKECRTIVTGYSAHGIQTLKLPCLYGGIRDIEASLTGTLTSFDLSAYISVAVYILDLKAFSRTAFRETKDIISFTRSNLRSTKDLSGGLIKIFQEYKVPRNISAYLNTIQPRDLQGFLNVIEIRNISAYIEGVWWKGQSDISTEFGKFFFRKTRTLTSYIHGWQTFDLGSSIVAFWIKDLQVELNAGRFKIPEDIPAFLNTVQPVDILATLQGYDKKDLYSFITTTLYGPNDLQSFISTIEPKNLSATIGGFFGVNITKSLLAYIIGSRTSDLGAIIDLIQPKNLAAYINSIGYFLDLPADIVPRTINIKRVISIPLMEHKDLKAVVNFNCQFSSYRDLSAYVYAFMKKDLKANIIGWYTGGTADTIRDLAAYINLADYKVIDTINIKGSAHMTHHVTHNISGGYKKSYKVFDTYNIIGGNAVANLTTYINGIFNSVNLSAEITPEYLPSFTTVPSWVNPKHREVIINLRRFEERWRRFIDLMFQTNDTTPYKYFYVSGEKKAYKIDKNRTWTILLTGYDVVEDNLIDRANIRKKLIFNLANYATVDEAIRDVMNRLSEYRQRDLNATISGLLSPRFDLAAIVKVKSITSWAKYLKCNITGVT